MVIHMSLNTGELYTGDIMENPITPELIAFKREVLESLYVGTCTIHVTKHIEDPDTRISKATDVIVVEDEPCRVTRQNASISKQKQSRLPDEFTETTNVMLAPEIVVPPGSVLVITMNGETKSYKASSDPQMYSDHQTIKIQTTGENEEFV